jgi:hypothetical protein
MGPKKDTTGSVPDIQDFTMGMDAASRPTSLISTSIQRSLSEARHPCIARADNFLTTFRTVARIKNTNMTFNYKQNHHLNKTMKNQNNEPQYTALYFCLETKNAC